uniref:Glutaredoxin, putative n=1 Tax=Theileria annulata TaxID=5874 RepID=A0A3B0MFV6_THEAN
MPNSFSHIYNNFVKYLNLIYRNKGSHSRLGLVNCIIFGPIEFYNYEIRERKSKTKPSFHFGSLNIRFQTKLPEYLSNIIAYAESDNKGCCSETESKEYVLTDRAFEKIKFEIETYEVVLFMKGTAKEPACGFSRQALDILKVLKVDTIRTVNVLQDEDVRNGIKAYSKYPYIPQLYVRGKFVGGLEKISKMFSDGSLEKLLRDG